MPPPGRTWLSGSLSRVNPVGSLFALTNHPARGFTSCGISFGGRISYGTAWPGYRFAAGSHSLPPWPVRMKYGGSPVTPPACRSSRSGSSALVKYAMVPVRSA